MQEKEIDQKQKRNLLSKVFNLLDIFEITEQDSSAESCGEACSSNPDCRGFALGVEGTIDDGDCRICFIRDGADYTVNLHDRYTYYDCPVEGNSL